MKYKEAIREADHKSQSYLQSSNRSSKIVQESSKQYFLREKCNKECGCHY